MNKAGIIIIILCTAIIAAVVYFSMAEKPGMGDIYLAGSLDTGQGSPVDEDIRDFSSRDSSIFLIIPVADARVGDRLDTEWLFLNGDGHRIIQADSIEIENDGGGTIAVYLVKRDGIYVPGKYMVKVEYNNAGQKQVSFSVTGGHSPEL